MTLDIQFKIKGNQHYQKFIRENSEWYKILNRNPDAFRQFEEVVKETYQLRPTDRISKALDTINMVQTVLSTIRP